MSKSRNIKGQEEELKKPKKKKKHKWFTLVELIVVITILAILWTIAFISFQSYNRSARDWVRLSDLNNIEKSLWLFIIEKWRYPEPDLWVNVTYSWWLAWTQWTVWDKMMTNLVNINKKPVDPLTGNEYTYSVTSLKNEYQVWAIQEIWLLWSLPITKTYAATLPTKKAFAIVKWTYNEVLLKVNTGSTDYILAVPSIINSDINDLDLLSIITKKLLVHNNFQNLPYSYNWLWYTMTGWFNYVPAWNKLEVYKWSLVTLNWDTGLKKQLLDDLKQSYNWTIIWWDSVYTDVIKLDTSNIRNIEILANNLLDNGILVKDKVYSSFIKWVWYAWTLIDTDSSNIYVWWIFLGTLTGALSSPLNSSWWYDWYVAKFDSKWNTIWANKIWWTGWDYLNSIAINWWNVYVGWYFSSNMIVWGLPQLNAVSYDGYLVKYDSSWNAVWARVLGWLSSDSVNSISTDSSWNIFVGWYFNNSMTLWWLPALSSWWANNDWYIAKYNSTGTPIWANKIWWNQHDEVTSVSVDSTWNVYAWWRFYTSPMTITWLPALTNSWTSDWFIAKYDNVWAPIWARKIWGTNQDSIDEITTDSAWNVYVGGYFSNSIVVWWTTLTSSWSSDIFVAKYNSAWTIIWAKKFWWDSSDYIESISVDSAWNIYAWWYYYSTNINIGTYTLTRLDAWWGNDWFVVKYDSSWNVLNAINIWTIYFDWVTSVKVWMDWKLFVWLDFFDKISIWWSTIQSSYWFWYSWLWVKFNSDLNVSY